MARKSPIEKAYAKERARLARFVREAEKRGFTWDKPLIPERPKKITAASVRRLKGITAGKAYEKAKYTDPATGESMSGLLGRARRRRESAQKAAATRRERGTAQAPEPAASAFEPAEAPPPGEPIRDAGEQILDSILEELGEWEPSPNWSRRLQQLKTQDVNAAQGIILGAISELGRDVVAANVEEHAMEIHAIIDRVMYAYGRNYDSQPDLIAITQIVRGQRVTGEENEEMTDMLDEIFDSWM